LAYADNDNMEIEAGKIRWPKRVSKQKIRRLYESDARGLLDTELLEDVGLQLCMRCEAILTVTEAKAGRVACPACARSGVNTIISRNKRLNPREERIACPKCDWKTTWSEYKRSFLRKQMNDGGAGPEFRSFVERYKTARTPTEKMLAVDQVIHSFHVYLLENIQTSERKLVPCRAACVNLIEGKLTDVVEFLDNLAYGSSSNPKLKETRDSWRESLHSKGYAEGFWKIWRFPGKGN
jgi:predicted RNA-binding Zn-ribbon protein involved in translation (DUF1610 family)